MMIVSIEYCRLKIEYLRNSIYYKKTHQRTPHGKSRESSNANEILSQQAAGN